MKQVEDGGQDIESELVEETEVLINEFKVRESLENQLKADLVKSQSSLAEMEEVIATLREENQALTDQVQCILACTALI